MNEEELLKNCITADFFSLKGQRKLGKIESIYDGDTCNVILILDSKPVKFRVRLSGIDCAEKRTLNEKEKEHALKALNFFKNWVNNELVILECKDFDKYGRLLASIYNKKNECINDLLLKERLAYNYGGKTKEQFQTWFNTRDCLISAQNIPKNIDDYNYYAAMEYFENLNLRDDDIFYQYFC